MTPPRQLSWFVVALTLVGVVAVGEGWLIYERAQAAKKAQAKLVQKRRELAAVSAIEPAPTADNAAAIEADLARLQRALEAMQTGLRGHGAAAEALRQAVAPERPADAFFDIATFVEKMRERAQRRGVALKSDERFGFAEYANSGPAPGLIPAVFRQRQIAEHLLVALCEAQPRQLLGVQRERPLTKAESEGADGGRHGGGATSVDYFEMDPRVSARVPGFVETTAFRLSFVGQTAVLRALLNQLASFELPLVVRSVEVEPAATPGERAEAKEPAGAAPAVAPLIRRTLSHFTVTVEYVDLVERKG